MNNNTPSTLLQEEVGQRFANSNDSEKGDIWKRMIAIIRLLLDMPVNDGFLPVGI